jgi:hypothetical protein
LTARDDSSSTKLGHHGLRSQRILGVDDNLTGKLAIINIADRARRMDTGVCAYTAPAIHVGICRRRFTQIMIEVYEIPRRSFREVPDELEVGGCSYNLMAIVPAGESLVAYLLIIENQDSHAITPHSLGPMV